MKLCWHVMFVVGLTKSSWRLAFILERSIIAMRALVPNPSAFTRVDADELIKINAPIVTVARQPTVVILFAWLDSCRWFESVHCKSGLDT